MNWFLKCFGLVNFVFNFEWSLEEGVNFHFNWEAKRVFRAVRCKFLVILCIPWLCLIILSTWDWKFVIQVFSTFNSSAVSLNGKFPNQLSEHLLVLPCLDKQLSTGILCCANMLQLHGITIAKSFNLYVGHIREFKVCLQISLLNTLKVCQEASQLVSSFQRPNSQHCWKRLLKLWQTRERTLQQLFNKTYFGGFIRLW